MVKTLEDLRDRSKLRKRIGELEQENRTLRSELQPFKELEELLKQKGYSAPLRRIVEDLVPNQAPAAKDKPPTKRLVPLGKFDDKNAR
jgi:predicted  nucleic acid-binding Zn-ribbon protein